VKLNQPVRYKSDKILCFYSKGDYPQFSNFYPVELETFTCRFNPDGSMKKENVIKYASAEHYFQIMKAMDFDPNGEVFKQMRGDISCKEIKALGRKVQNFDARKWNLRRRYHMSTAVWKKFRQNPELLELLLGTGNAVLAETSPRDTFWGIGYSASNPKS